MIRGCNNLVNRRAGQVASHRLRDEDRGVSEVLGVVMLLAMVITIMGGGGSSSCCHDNNNKNVVVSKTVLKRNKPRRLIGGARNHR